LYYIPVIVFICQDYESSVVCSVKNETDVDEKLTHMRPVVEQGTLNLALYVTPLWCILLKSCWKLKTAVYNAEMPVY